MQATTFIKTSTSHYRPQSSPPSDGSAIIFEYPIAGLVIMANALLRSRLIALHVGPIQLARTATSSSNTSMKVIEACLRPRES